MADFIAISGPSSSGKTELFNALKGIVGRESGVVFLPDIFHTVWQDLVDKGLFYEEEDINKDSELLCCFIQRVTDKYKEYIETYKDKDMLVIIDSCWVDISIYSMLNMWYNHVLKELQESLLSRVCEYDDSLSRIYITNYEDSRNTVPKYHSRFKRYNVKYNRPLEIKHYELASHYENAIGLPAMDAEELANYIIEDLEDLGYL